MTNHDLEVFDDGDFNQESAKKRPVFIVVLAILSWLFVAFGVLSGVSASLSNTEEQFAQMDEAIQAIDDADDMPMREDIIEYLEAIRDNYKINNLGQMLLLLIEGVAVYMMFRLKRMGFWLYTLSQIGIIALLVYILPFPNIMSTMIIAMYGFIILLFEILYAVNLKHMK